MPTLGVNKYLGWYTSIPSLISRRATRENILTFSIDLDAEKFIAGLVPQVVKDPQSAFAILLDSAVRDAYERLLQPSIQNEVRTFLKERSESEAINVFEENLRLNLPADNSTEDAIVAEEWIIRHVV